MKFLLSFSRVFVGGLFILSGFIKANDTVGFSFKLEEYFSEAVFDIPFLMPFALTIAIVMCIAEIVLGLNAILGIKPKFNGWALLIMILFFSGLTFYSAYFDKVTDCGCFGDALKFTPWQSFIKDVVLLVFVLILFFKRDSESFKDKALANKLLVITWLMMAFFSIYTFNWYLPIIFSVVLFGLAWMKRKFLSSDTASDMGVMISAFTLSAIFVWMTYAHLPAKDYRPYKEGASIPEGMTVPEGAPVDEFEVFVQHVSTGEIKQIPMAKIDWSDKNWKYMSDREPILVKEGAHPPIHDFSIVDSEGYDITEEVMEWENVVIVISYNYDKSKTTGWSKITPYIQGAKEAGVTVIGLTASELGYTAGELKAKALEMDLYNTDETTLKTIVRSNPGIIRLERGVIKNKWHFNDVPEKF